MPWFGLVRGRDSNSACWPPRPRPSDNIGKIYSDPVCSELVRLGNVRLCGTALDRTFLLTSNGAGFLQVIGHVGDTTHELAMATGTLGACRNKIRNGAAAGEQGIGDPSIAAIDNNGGAQIGIGAIILVIRNTIAV